jgi:type II secretory ATPase GspE/PulE/Tfp pilus assembly ATPase PilB-like protein
MQAQPVEKLRLGELLVQEEFITRQQLEEILTFQRRLAVYKPLGEICTDMGLISRLELKDILAKHQKRILLGDLLVNMGIVNEQQVTEALKAQRESGKRLGEILIEKGFATHASLADALSIQLGIPKIVPDVRLIDPALLEGMNVSFFYAKGVVPLGRDDERGVLTVIMNDPLDFATIADMEKIYRTKIEPAVSVTGETTHLLDYFCAPPRAPRKEPPEPPRAPEPPPPPPPMPPKQDLPASQATPKPGPARADEPRPRTGRETPPAGLKLADRNAQATRPVAETPVRRETTATPKEPGEEAAATLKLRLADAAGETPPPAVEIRPPVREERQPPKKVMVPRREEPPVEERVASPAEKDLVIDENITLTSTGKENTVGILDFIVAEAVREGTSDIHIEPLENRVRVRYRVDGLLRHKTDLPTATGVSLTNRIKALCGLDIAERRRHQDGRIQARILGKDVDLRVSTYAAIWGENIVIRILHRQSSLVDLNRTGLTPLNLDKFQRMLKYPAGVMLVTGPTGSGKTTTLYAAIQYLNDLERKIITVEDPVEYTIDGVIQAKLDPKLHMTYDDFIKSMMRQDPDVIMIGEIRDELGAGAAIQAALTGHKVFSTFHTDDSTSALVRLMNMGIETFLISSTVVAVIAQRLVRTLCPNCKEPGAPSPLTLRAFSSIQTDNLEGFGFYRPKGCHQCNGTGYKGRTTVQELLEINDPIREAILQRKHVSQIRVTGRETAHLVSMAEDGFYKAAKGITTLEEVQRVVYINGSDALVPYDAHWLYNLCDAPEAAPSPVKAVKKAE